MAHTSNSSTSKGSSTTTKDHGLESYWGQVMVVLCEIIPIYDKVNSIISLGRDTTHRNRGISGRVSTGDHILDAGSGFGNMSKTAMALAGGKIHITLYDPLVPMLKNTSTLFEQTPDMASGVFEHLPFKDGEFDAVLCGYSLRDAIRLRDAISELYRVLKTDGRLIIVDLGKPDNLIIRSGVSFYLRCILPLLAFAAGGKLGLKFGALYGTFQRWPQNKTLESLLLEKFSRVKFDKDLMGGAIMVAAYK